VTYYIRNNSQGVPSLYRKTNMDAVEELVDGVEHMQVRYGIDNDNDRAVDQYVNANAIGDWNNVYSVRVGVVLRSVEEIAKWDLDTNTYDADGNGTNEYDPVDDKRLRMVMHMTSGLRNRLP
jgi:type IV pilus assembly protein PilW